MANSSHENNNHSIQSFSFEDMDQIAKTTSALLHNTDRSLREFVSDYDPNYDDDQLSMRSEDFNRNVPTEESNLRELITDPRVN